MVTNTLTLGTPNSLSFDFSDGVSNIFIKEPNNYDILYHFQKALEPYKNKPVTLLLSGGIDSQFTYNVYSRFCKNVKCVTFRLMWDDSVVNPGDVVSSKIFADHMGADHTYIDFNIKEFLEDKQVLNFAKEYYFNSPQLATHAKCILDNHDDSHFVLGTEITPVGYFEGECYVPGYKPKNPSAKMRIEQDKDLYKRRYIPWLNFAQKEKIDLTVDPFYLSPEILYLAFYHNMRVLKKHNHLPYMYNNKKFKYNLYDYKVQFYKSFDWADYKVPLRKETGFEVLRLEYMKSYGSLDSFNLMLRKPLQDHCERTDWYNKRQYQLAPKYHGVDDLLAIFNEHIKDKDIKDSNTISIDI